MRQWIVMWWHRRVLGHQQVAVMNGATEPGVQCHRVEAQMPFYRWVRCRWFPSDGGHGK